MEEFAALQSFAEVAQWLWDEVVRWVMLFISPGWRQYQLFIIIGLIGAAFLLRLIVAPRVEAWARSRSGWDKWQLRMLVQLRRMLGLICYAVLAWAVYLVMQQATWPSRSYLIGVAATLVTLWIVVAFVTRLVANAFLRRIVAWALWIYGTLYALNVSDDVAEFLDSLTFGIGEVRLSVLTVLQAAVLIAVLLAIARLATTRASGALRRNEDISPSMQVLAVKAVQALVYGIVLMIAIRALGFDLTGLAVLSGAIGLGIGFGLQKVVSNLVSGIIILLDKSIKPGDVISLGDTFGWIDSLGARYVSVVTRDGKEYLIPNEDLITSQVVNWSHTNKLVRLDLHFGVSYGDDPHRVRKLAIEAAAGVRRVLSNPNPPVCHITGFGDSSVDYILRFWITDPSDGLTNIKGNVYLALWDSFAANGVSFPFPQREVRVLPGSTLETTATAPGAKE
ncbi:mechanosensitive ion channel family protein [Arenibacterium halophilum]|uniref:Mechanosensitive ion channel n=1 Tax=Arenibacterium halophilum TaxID=2583821 RepID=A0ABY2X7A1_9RHOB|nr:mechanosensitive ion channel [Arenibacterium halophilum]